MADYKFSIPIAVRYGDLDPQWHVNNARYLTFLEQARLSYLKELGLFQGNHFLNFPLIVADIHIRYLAPIMPDQSIRVWMRTEKIGNKSLEFSYEIRDDATQQVLARAETIMVTYDYNQQKTIPVSAEWRSVISSFEGRDFL
jgi:acyl-CoA thioester hydrolase